MTKRIFDTDVMQRTCQAVVTACSPYKKGYAIQLDQTVFFPEGGGQLSDTGRLQTADKSVQVTHVAEKDGDVLHETREAIPVGTHVKAVLDWESRMDHMQQHCGEHLLSYAFWHLYQAHNIGFHMNPELVTIDFDKELTWEQAMAAEQLANQHIQDNRPVTTQIVTPEEAARMNLRKFNSKITGPVRIVSIEGSDSCTCCGTHPPMTGMVGLIKIFKVERHRGGTRLTLLCGRLALNRIREEMVSATKAANMLSVREADLPEAIERLQAEKNTLIESLHERTEQLLDYRLAEIQQRPCRDAQGNTLVVLLDNALDARSAKRMLERLLELPRMVAVLLYPHGERVNYLVGTAPDATASAPDILRSVNTELNGKGGGKAHQAQGSAPYTPDAENKVKSAINGKQVGCML